MTESKRCATVIQSHVCLYGVLFPVALPRKRIPWRSRVLQLIVAGAFAMPVHVRLFAAPLLCRIAAEVFLFFVGELHLWTFWYVPCCCFLLFIGGISSCCLLEPCRFFSAALHVLTAQEERFFQMRCAQCMGIAFHSLITQAYEVYIHFCVFFCDSNLFWRASFEFFVSFPRSLNVLLRINKTALC